MAVYIGNLPLVAQLAASARAGLTDFSACSHLTLTFLPSPPSPEEPRH